MVHFFQVERVRTADDWKFGSAPSRFLEPPPLSRSYRAHSVKYHHRNPQVNARFSWIPEQKPLSLVKSWQPFDQIAKSVDYSYDLHCNPCNSVPWIPIITFAHPKAIQQPQTQPVPPITSYYQSLNEMTANLLKPVTAVPHTLPFYIGPPVYQQQIHGSLWQGVPPISEHAVSQVSANHIDSVHSQEAAQSVKNVDNINLSNWVQETKPVPLFHYTHSVDYPAQFEQTAALDLPIQPAPLPPQPIPYIAPSGLGNADQSDSLHDVSNHLDDNKYSSSENKYSVTSNETVKGSKQLFDNGTNDSVDLTDYLTPPSDVSRDEWQQTNDAEKKAKPLDEWAFVKDLQTKPEKRKKQIQIVIPYTVNKGKYQIKSLKENITDNWSLTLKSNDARSTTILPIVRFLRDSGAPKKQSLTDWQKLRKAIDTWTVERFSNHKYNSSSHVDVTTGLPAPVKDIAENLLQIGMPFREGEGVKEKPDEIENRVSSGQKSDTVDTDTELKRRKTLPESASTTSKEKVYIVTPVPLSSYNFSSNYIGDENWGLG